MEQMNPLSKLCIAAGNLLNSLFAKFMRSSAMVVRRRERFEKKNGVDEHAAYTPRSIYLRSLKYCQVG
jgi:hypothetical protein